MKFLKDGLESDNILAMPNMVGVNSWNFFEQPFSNRVKPFDPVANPIEHLTVQKKMAEANFRPFVTGIGHIGHWNHDMTPVAEGDVVIPYELTFTSPRRLPAEKKFDKNGDQVMFHKQLQRIFSRGDIVLQVHAPILKEDPYEPREL